MRPSLASSSAPCWAVAAVYSQASQLWRFTTLALDAVRVRGHCGGWWRQDGH